MLREDGFLTVEALAERYGVTTQTIRRDLTTLCDYGLARRRHGGIENPADVGNLAYGSRQILARSAKQAIAREVARHIPDNASVAFSIGTTPEVVAAGLLHHNGLRIYPNSLNIALLACTNPTFEVNIAGGRVRSVKPKRQRPGSPLTVVTGPAMADDEHAERQLGEPAAGERSYAHHARYVSASPVTGEPHPHPGPPAGGSSLP